MINKLKTLICMTLMRLPMAGTLRGRFAVMAGVRLRVPNGEKPHLFVGENVRLDHLNPDGIEIGNWTTLATGVVILSHYLYYWKGQNRACLFHRGKFCDMQEYIYR